MDASMARYFYTMVKNQLDPAIPLFFKPANHLQEKFINTIPATEMPRVWAHELHASADYVSLHAGTAKGRLRVFAAEEDFRAALATVEWFDIIVMDRVPDCLPRVAGIINAQHTTPLSHTNVLATGWQIPNAIQIGVRERIEREQLDGQWVDYQVDPNASGIVLTRIEKPEVGHAPPWRVHRIKLEEPETVLAPIVELDQLRMSDLYRYGTKAANLGELHHLLRHGSERLIGFYRVRRPPRQNLLPYLAQFLGVPEGVDLSDPACQFLQELVQVPRGIAIPFALQQQFLESSPRIQQGIGKLKMALELNAREIEPICVSLANLIRTTRFPEQLRQLIDSQVATRLAGISSFVVRSSSNAEDLEGFSAAGIYESFNRVSTAENLFDSIRQVWASLVSPRSVRLRQQVGISLDDTYMGVIVQEEVRSEIGGVLVTTNPMNRDDFRNVYINVSPRSVTDIVQGTARPLQYLYNTVEGSGRTLSIGDAPADLADDKRELLQKLAFAGRLLQSHFASDYTFSCPVDMEWAANSEGLFVLQLRPYAG